MKQRAAWNSNLLMMKEQIVTIDEILQSNNEPDVICFDSSLVEDGCSTDVILLLAQAAKFSLFISGPYCKEEWGIDYGPLQVCFNERFGQFNPQNDRHYFEVENGEIIWQTAGGNSSSRNKRCCCLSITK